MGARGSPRDRLAAGVGDVDEVGEVQDNDDNSKLGYA
jgi:hypothetical protein